MSKTSIANSPEEVRASVSSIYSDLLQKRKTEKESKAERKLREKEERELEKEQKKAEKKAEKESEENTRMSKAERRQAEMDAWKNIIVGLTGDDLDYSDSKGKGKRKKYRKWIGEDDNNSVTVDKPKKVKKTNYQKKFEPELNMLKTVVADQNKFTLDLQKRFQNAVGPATKDAMPLNKTMVELAAAINSSRANSLGLIREIGNLKKTIADLYMKQQKLEADLGAGGGTYNSADLGLMGSSIASTLFPSTPVSFPSGGESMDNSAPIGGVYQQGTPQQEVSQISQPIVQGESFDPDTWTGGSSLAANDYVNYESIPHTVVVEWHKDKGVARFKAVRDDTGEELIGCPVPTSDPSKLSFNEKDLKVKGEFDETYKLEIV